MKKLLLSIAALAVLLPTAAMAQNNEVRNLDENGALPRATPESVGASSEKLLDALQKLDAETRRIDSIMVLRHGRVIMEAWRAPHAPDVPHPLYSLSKSFASTAVGFAVQEGKMKLDQKVVDLFPEDVPENPSENLKKMTVRDLLTMTCGHDREPERPNNISAFYNRPGPNQDGNPTWLQMFMRQSVPFEPGTHYQYNTVSTYVATAACEKLVGQNAFEYLKTRLFDPLHITDAVWENSPEGITKGGTGLFLTTEDIAKFGQFLLQRGKWNGEQLLNAAWIDEATSNLVPTSGGEKSNWGQGYGYQFWRCLHNAYRGDGMYGQYCVVAPDQDAVIAITSDGQNTARILDLALDLILPIFQDDPLPENPDGVAKLRAAEKELKPQEGGSKGELIPREVKDARGETVRYIVYVPAGYMTNSDSLPVLYLLHGMTDDEKTWSNPERGNMLAICDAYFAEHPERRTIVVMPDARKTWYRNVFNSDDQYETFFFETLVPQVEREFRCRSDRGGRFVAGLSMGGYGTLLYALRHRDMFGAAYAMSPAVSGGLRPGPNETEAERDARAEYNAENDLYRLLKVSPPESLPRLTIDCGDDDVCLPGSFEFYQATKAQKARCEFRVRNGSHSWDYWRVSLPKVLDFISGENP